MCRANIISITVEREEIVTCCGKSYRPAFTDVTIVNQQTTGNTHIYSNLMLGASYFLAFHWASGETVETSLTSYKPWNAATTGCTVKCISCTIVCNIQCTCKCKSN